MLNQVKNHYKSGALIQTARSLSRLYLGNRPTNIITIENEREQTTQKKLGRRERLLLSLY